MPDNSAGDAISNTPALNVDVYPASLCTATRSNTNNRPAPNLPSGSDSQGRASVEPRANPGKARPTRVLR